MFKVVTESYMTNPPKPFAYQAYDKDTNQKYGPQKTPEEAEAYITFLDETKDEEE